MATLTNPHAGTTPAEARTLFRAGLVTPTSGWSDGFAQANLIALTPDYASEFQEFARLNPRSCPVIEVIPSHRFTSTLAADSDIRTDLPLYRVWRNGELSDEPTEVGDVWQDSLVTLLIGCSFTFEAALREAGIPLRHVEMGRNVPMYVTNRHCIPAGRVHGPLVVSMRPMPTEMVPLAQRVTARVPRVHGAPVHVGDPAALGIRDLDRPDYGDPVEIRDGEVPVFWACGVTPQAAVIASRPAFAISHSPGHMLITDVPESEFRVTE